MPVESILRGLQPFQKKVYPKHRELFQELALQQRPKGPQPLVIRVWSDFFPRTQ